LGVFVGTQVADNRFEDVYQRKLAVCARTYLNLVVDLVQLPAFTRSTSPAGNSSTKLSKA